MNLGSALALLDEGKAITRPFWVGAWVQGTSKEPRVHYASDPTTLPWYPLPEEAYATDYKEYAHVRTETQDQTGPAG